MLRLALAFSSFLSTAFLTTAALSACASSSKSVENGPSDSSAPDALVNPGTVDGAADPQLIPPHVFAVHGAHLNSIGDVRLCPSADDARARPDDNRIPRASYPGVVRGGFAEIENPGMWTSPFAVDAYGLGMAEQAKAIPCTQLDGDFYVKVRLSPVALVKPGIVALVDGPGDAGAEGGVPPVVQSIPVATTAQVPSFQIVSLSRDLISPRLIVRRGPLDGKCSAGELYDGQGTYAAALNSPLPFPAPSSDFDGSGIQVCVAPLNGTPELLISRSWAELQAASEPETVPGDFYAQKALFVIVLMGEKAAVDPSSQLHAVMIPFNVAK